MESLFVLQYSSLMVCSMLALMLIVSAFQQNATSRQYRRSRWMIVISMLILAIHYFLQMRYDLRATSDDIGTVVNILFYMPMAFFISYSIMEMECGRNSCRRYAWIGSCGCVATTLTFFLGWLYYGNLQMCVARYVMHTIFILEMIYFIISPVIAIKRNQRRVENETGGDILPYHRYAWSSYLMLCLSSSSLVVAVMYRPLLYIFGPLLLLTLFLFIQSFVALGYNLAVVEDVLTDGAERDATATEHRAADEAIITADIVDSISSKLERWIADGGFRDKTVNMAKLSQQLLVSRRDLSNYFDLHLHSTFRVWLSNIRFGEAQRLILEHPEYSNDTVSTGCGFSSRSQLYKIFSDRTGMTPREWHEAQLAENQ